MIRAELASSKAKIDTLTANVVWESEQRGYLEEQLSAMKKQLAVMTNDEESQVKRDWLRNYLKLYLYFVLNSIRYRSYL